MITREDLKLGRRIYGFEQDADKRYRAVSSYDGKVIAVEDDTVALVGEPPFDYDRSADSPPEIFFVQFIPENMFLDIEDPARPERYKAIEKEMNNWRML